MGEEVSIADLSLICELAHLKAFDMEYKDFPKISQWMNRMMEFKEIKEMHDRVIPILKTKIVEAGNAKL